MSPEQVDGQEADQRSDIYSLGIIIYEMVTGQVPFAGDTPFSIALKHKNETPLHPKKFNIQTPDDLTHVILKCMEKDKEIRYQTVEEVLSALKNIDLGVTPTSVETKKEMPEPSYLKKQKRFFLIPAIVVAVIAVIIVGYLIFTRLRQRPVHEVEIVTGAKWKNSIAVLPFRDNSVLKDQEPICPEASWIKKYRAILYAANGERELSLSFDKNIEVLALLGMKDEAIKLLDEEILKREIIPYIYYFDLLNNPFYDNLRDDTRFKGIVQREKTLYEEHLKKYGIAK